MADHKRIQLSANKNMIPVAHAIFSEDGSLELQKEGISITLSQSEVKSLLQAMLATRLNVTEISVVYTDIMIPILREYPPDEFEYAAVIVFVVVNDYGQNTWTGEYHYTWEVSDRDGTVVKKTPGYFASRGEFNYEKDTVEAHNEFGEAIVIRDVYFTEHIQKPTP